MVIHASNMILETCIPILQPLLDVCTARSQVSLNNNNNVQPSSGGNNAIILLLRYWCFTIICITHGGVTTRRLHLEENPTFLRETDLILSDVWAPTTTLLCSIFLPVLFKAIPCIGKDLGMSTVAYASLMVELQQDAYTSKTRESHLFEGNRSDRFGCLGTDHYLVVLYFPASACQSHPMYR